jgi:type II secretory pathway pseudopilin PulG
VARALLVYGAEALVTRHAGFSLIEAVMALALTATIAIGVSTSLVASRAAGVRARDTAIAVIAARARLAELAALRFDIAIGADGVAAPRTDAGLAPSPPDALSADRAGYVDYLDASGAPLGADARAAASAAYVRRWTIGRQGGGPAEAALVAVMVAPVAVERRVRALGDPARLVDQPEAVLLRGALVRHAS